MSYHSKKTVDRGYPPQHSVESEKEFNIRKKEAVLEHRDRRSFDSPVSATPTSEFDRYELRQLDDPKQVGNQ